MCVSCAAARPVDFKLVLLGAASVGKTCLLQRFLHDKWSGTPYVTTVGAAFGVRELAVGGGAKVNVGVWDTAGTERYESMTKLYFSQAAGALVCFDLTDAASFERVKYWVRELQAAQEGALVVLVGTKADLLEEGRPRSVSREAALAYAKQINAPYFETSSKSGKGVEDPFLDLAQRLHRQPPQLNMYDPDVIHVRKPARQPTRTKCCN